MHEQVRVGLAAQLALWSVSLASFELWIATQNLAYRHVADVLETDGGHFGAQLQEHD